MNQDVVQERSAPIKPPLERKRPILFLLELLIAIVVGALLKPLLVGGIHWIFGGIIGGAIVFHVSRTRYNYTAQSNRTARQLGLILIGSVIGFSIHGDWSIAYAVPAFLLLSFFLLVSGSIIGWIYSKVGNVNLLTAMLATMPGNLLLMASIAADYRKNVALVSLIQLLRYTSIILFIPFFVRLSVQEQAVALPKTEHVTWSFNTLGISALALLAITAGVYLAIRLKVMAAPYFGALAAAVFFNLTLNWLSLAPASGFTPPHLVNIFGQLLLGISIGEYWGNKPALGQRTVAYSLISVVLTI
ncbi:MAG TPA: AbrB family transcriptional regulator, partial [Allocoleopsis sp.]